MKTFEERKRIGAKCGHVKRRLVQEKRLTGKVLDFALEVLDRGYGDKDIARVISAKLRNGQSLSDYELHLMVDGFLVHERMSE